MGTRFTVVEAISLAVARTLFTTVITRETKIVVEAE